MGDVGASVGERGNVQHAGGNRVSTISLLGCSTSVALTMGPTDEEEESQANPCRIYGVQSDTGTGFSLTFSVMP